MEIRDIIIIITFLLLNLAVGLFYGSGIKNIKQYAIGNRDFKTATLVATIVGTWISGSICSVMLSKSYEDGFLYLFATNGIIINFCITAYIFAPRMKEYLGRVSIGDVMGSLYGKYARFVTAFSGIIISMGMITAQVKVMSYILLQLIVISDIYLIIIVSSIIITYSAMGGIKAVTLTDGLQLATFGTLLPLLLIALVCSIGGPEVLVEHAITSLNKVQDSKLKIEYYSTLFIYFLIPTLGPALFQRALMASNTEQIQNSFKVSALIIMVLLFMMSVIGILVYIHNPMLQSNHVVQYIVQTYILNHLKSLSLCAILAMIMSTIDSHLNAATIALVHDFYKPIINQEGKDSTWDIFLLRLGAIIIGILSVTIALRFQNIIELLLIAHNFYMPIITVPLTLAILGFRSTSKAVLIGMFSGALTVIIWKWKLQLSTGIDSLFPGMIANAVFFMSSHYILGETGGWIGPQEPGPLNAIRIRRRKKLVSWKQFIISFPQRIAKFSIIKFCNKHALQQISLYPKFGITFIITHFISYLSFSELSENIFVIYIGIFICGTVLISAERLNNTIMRHYLSIIWMFAAIFCLPFASGFLMLESNLSKISILIFTANLMIMLLLFEWQLALVQIIIAEILALYLYLSMNELSITAITTENIMFLGSFLVIMILCCWIVIPSLLKHQKQELQAELQSLRDEQRSLDEDNINLDNIQDVANVIDIYAHIRKILNSITTEIEITIDAFRLKILSVSEVQAALQDIFRTSRNIYHYASNFFDIMYLDKDWA